MLVLSRKVNERIFLDVPGRENPIIIQVVALNDQGKLSLGIDADRDIKIAREELLSNDSTHTV
jgi:carbon storage regulator CsrA